MYKDKYKQKEANRLAAQRRRDKAKGMTEGMTNSGYDAQGMTPGQRLVEKAGLSGSIVNVDSDAVELPDNFGQSDCQCMHCQQNRGQGYKFTINHGTYKPDYQLSKNEVNRVSLPGDPDYTGVSQEDAA